ncbi:DUF4296 domain-containing protein [Flavobacterium sp.]|uniref:DUF4296 domain-containing protein n=1 Tax=Flavobacterium sp. TaxID=239 RepID=UPI003BD048E1
MKKFILLFTILILGVVGCKDEIIPKPKNLISKEKMEDIIYDLSLLEAARTRNSSVQNFIKPTEFIKSKYKVDSLTFAKSTQYYASDIKEYQKMYDSVKGRLIKENEKLSKKIK